MLASSTLSTTGTTGMLYSSMLFPTELACRGLIIVGVQMAKALVFRALSSRSCRVQLLYSNADSGNIEPIPNSSVGLLPSSKGNCY